MIAETLQVFVTVAELRNFSRAAEHLHLSQPGVSLHIRNLEKEYGARLLHRTSKQVQLTEAGAILYRHAKQILHLQDKAREDIRLLQGEVTGSIRIGASFTIGEYYLPRLLAGYAGEYPQIEIEVTVGNTEEILQGIRSNALDFGLVEGEVSHPEVEASLFLHDEMVVVAPPDHILAAGGALDPGALNGQVWVMREPGSGTRAFSDRFLESHGLSAGRIYIFNSSQGIKEAVAAGLGIAMLSRLVAHRELDAGELIELRLRGVRSERDCAVLQHKSAVLTMAQKVFLRRILV